MPFRPWNCVDKPLSTGICVDARFVDFCRCVDAIVDTNVDTIKINNINIIYICVIQSTAI